MNQVPIKKTTNSIYKQTKCDDYLLFGGTTLEGPRIGRKGGQFMCILIKEMSSRIS